MGELLYFPVNWLMFMLNIV